MIKKLFKNSKASKNTKVVKLEKGQLKQVIGGLDGELTTVTSSSLTEVHQELHRPCTTSK